MLDKSSEPPAELDTRERHSENEPPAKPAASSVDDPILSFTQAGLLCNRSATTIRRWCDEGLISYVRFPGIPVGRRGIRTSTMNRFLGGTNVLAERGSSTVPRMYQTREQTEVAHDKP